MDRQSLYRVILAAPLLLASVCHAQIYQWKDSDGRIRFSDHPPQDAAAKTITLEKTDVDTGPSYRIDIEAKEFNLSPEGEARIRETLPAIIRTYKQLFNLDIRHQVVVRLSLLKDKPSFDRWLAKRSNLKDPQPLLGVYLIKQRQVAVWDQGSEEDVIKTILHESSHVIVAQLSPYAPSWLQEGLAEYFERSNAHNGILTVQPSQRGLGRIRNWMHDGNLVTLRTYLNIPEQKWHKMAHDLNAIPYTVAWGMMYFLLSDDSGRKTLRRMMQALEKNHTWPTADDMDHRYPGGLTVMDLRFFRWAQGDVNAHTYNVGTDPDSDPGSDLSAVTR